MILIAGAALMISGGSARVARHRIDPPPSAGASANGSVAKFEFLARQTSNSCGLTPGSVATMPSQMRLQGSYCTTMQLAAYKAQVRGLRRYASIAQIPSDPYDIAVPLAKRLLAYDLSIRLTAPQQRVYSQGMRDSSEKGPCCCRCWRWSAFEGLSRYLIAERSWKAPALGHLIGLLDGCGGPPATGGS